MSFVHLHVHSEYSLLDGYSNITRMVQRAKEMGMPALALTDHGTMFGVIDFFNAAKREGIKPIIGVEAYMAARGMTDRDAQYDKRSSHLLLLAENQTGYQNLLKIASASQLEGYYYRPRIDHEFLAAHSEGLITTTGCLSGEVPRAIVQDNLAEAERKLDWYYEVFGPDNFFIELQGHDIPELRKANKGLFDFGKRYNSKFIVTNDVHYIEREDARYQDILLCVQTGSLLSDPKRMRMDKDSFYMRSPEEMAALFPQVPEAVSNTLMIAERCEVDLTPTGYHLPEFDVPEGHTAQTYLRELCDQGLRARCGRAFDDPVYLERLEYELGIIHEMGFDAYFLIVWDLCRHAQDLGIWYNARGSAAGSLVAYTLEITMVDPIEHQLIFERFLNPGRVSMPDIDLDFQDDLRYKLMEYCAQKYGDDKVAAIITFGKLKARAAVRDVGRVLDIPLNEVDRVAKLIPNIPGKPVSIAEALEQIPELKQEYDSRSYIRELIDTAQKMENVTRNAGTHAAGVVVTDKPVVEYVPLHRPTGNSEDTPVKTVTQFDMGTVDALGLLKVDFLGLSTLTIMARACQYIKDRHGVDLGLHNIPIDDPETFALLGRGETAGVFQLEGTGMTRWVMEMKPENLAHVIAMVALYRPGPMDFIPDYIARMQGKAEVTYRHEMLEPILKETYGITVYQEQIMYTAMNLGGYTASEADFLRKTVAKKKEKELLEQRQKFVTGAMERGIPEETANEIFNDWEAFARYGFPKGHAADYAVIAVQTAYLKTKYTVEYMTALLSVYENDSDKVAAYVNDCNKMGIEVLPPNINYSEWDFSIEDQEDGRAAIRFSLGAVKNVGRGPVDALMAARSEGGEFEDLIDFAHRVDLRQVGKRALESMIRVGALDTLGPRQALLEIMDRLISISSSHYQAKESGQMSFFGESTGIVEEITLPEIDSESQFARREALNWERELIGIYISDHPLGPLMPTLKKIITHSSGDLSLAENQQNVRVAGLVTRIRYHRTKNGKEMAFVGIEDTQGLMDLVIFPRTWEQVREIIEYDKVVVVEGKVDLAKGDPNILVDNIRQQIALVESVEEIEERKSQVQVQAASPPQQTNEIAPQILSDAKHRHDTPHSPAQKAPPPAQTAPQAAPQPEQTLEPISESQAKAPQVAEQRKPYTPNVDVPPPPDDYPDDWDTWGMDDADYEGDVVLPDDLPPVKRQTNGTVKEKVLASSQPQTQQAVEPEKTDPEPKAAEPVQEVKLPVEAVPVVPVVQSGEDKLKDLPGLTMKLNAQQEAEQPQKPPAEAQMLRIVLRSTKDQARDMLHIRRIHGKVISYPGNDRFSFYIIEGNKGYLMEFPNDTTGISEELKNHLCEIVGVENVRVEPITYQ